jgi:hypothetical protein
MEDLGLVAELLKTSSTLTLAAASLEKLANGKSANGKEEFNSSERDALKWSGNFLLAVDWSADQPSTQEISGGLALQATSVRPTFYSCLFRMAPQIRAEGIKEEKDLLSFLSFLYKNLLILGDPKKAKRVPSDQSRLKLGALLLHEMAESLLIQINNNGLPRPTTTLKDEWKANELTPALAF